MIEISLKKKYQIITFGELKKLPDNVSLCVEYSQDNVIVETIVGIFNTDKHGDNIMYGVSVRENDRRSGFYGFNIPENFKDGDLLKNVPDEYNKDDYDDITVYSTIDYTKNDILVLKTLI